MFGTYQSRAVISRLQEAGYEAVFVGGAVRDYLLGTNPKDIDIATSATPQQVLSLFNSTIELGTEHGTVLVVVDGDPIEVTTYRTEGTYSDQRRPDTVQFVTSLTEDLKRRDFTINALAMRLDGAIEDPFGGRDDLRRKTLRAVGNPIERFSEDALRMIRAIRFVSTLGFTLEQATKDAIKELAPSIQNLSVERIKAEFDKLFIGDYAEEALNLLSETRLSVALPLYIEATDDLLACTPFRHSLEGWATVMITGKYTPALVANAYKLSNVERIFLRGVHALFEIRKQRDYSTYDYYQNDLDTMQTTEKLVSKILNKPRIEEQELQQAITSLPIHSKKDLAVKGEHLIKWQDKKPGRWVGEHLNAIEQAVLYGRLANDYHAIKEWYDHDFND